MKQLGMKIDPICIQQKIGSIPFLALINRSHFTPCMFEEHLIQNLQNFSVVSVGQKHPGAYKLQNTRIKYAELF